MLSARIIVLDFFTNLSGPCDNKTGFDIQQRCLIIAQGGPQVYQYFAVMC